MKKRLLAMLMVLMLVVSLLPVGVLAAGTGGTREITSYVTPSYNSDEGSPGSGELKTIHVVVRSSDDGSVLQEDDWNSVWSTNNIITVNLTSEASSIYDIESASIDRGTNTEWSYGNKQIQFRWTYSMYNDEIATLTIYLCPEYKVPDFPKGEIDTGATIEYIAYEPALLKLLYVNDVTDVDEGTEIDDVTFNFVQDYTDNDWDVTKVPTGADNLMYFWTRLSDVADRGNPRNIRSIDILYTLSDGTEGTVRVYSGDLRYIKVDGDTYEIEANNDDTSIVAFYNEDEGELTTWSLYDVEFVTTGNSLGMENMPDDPTYLTYVFTNWDKNVNGGDPFLPSEIISDDTVVYAQKTSTDAGGTEFHVMNTNNELLDRVVEKYNAENDFEYEISDIEMDSVRIQVNGLDNKATNRNYWNNGWRSESTYYRVVNSGIVGNHETISNTHIPHNEVQSITVYAQTTGGQSIEVNIPIGADPGDISVSLVKDNIVEIHINDKPSAPSAEELEDTDPDAILGTGAVTVDCDNSEHDNKTYGLISGAYTTGSVEWRGSSTDGAYYYDITIDSANYAAYVSKYDADTNGDETHSVVTGEATSKTITLVYGTDGWEVYNNTAPVTINVTCDAGDPGEPTDPEKPDEADLGKLSVTLDCVTADAEHDDGVFKLESSNCTVADVVASTEGVYTCDVTPNYDSILAAYNKDVEVTHTYVDGTNPVFTLTWDAESKAWVADNTSITRSVQCESTELPDDYVAEYHVMNLYDELDIIAAEWGHENYIGFYLNNNTGDFLGRPNEDLSQDNGWNNDLSYYTVKNGAYDSEDYMAYTEVDGLHFYYDTDPDATFTYRDIDILVTEPDENHVSEIYVLFDIHLYDDYNNGYWYDGDQDGDFDWVVYKAQRFTSIDDRWKAGSKIILEDLATADGSQQYYEPIHADVNGRNVVFLGWDVENHETIYEPGDEPDNLITDAFSITGDVLRHCNITPLEVCLYGVYGYAEPATVTIAPANITAYVGGDGYAGVTDGNGNIIGTATTSGLPEPGYHIELSSDVVEWFREHDVSVSGDDDDAAEDLAQYISFVYYDESGNLIRHWDLEYVGVYKITESGLATRYVYSLSNDTIDANHYPVRIEYLDGQNNPISTDGILDMDADTVKGTYTMKIDSGNVIDQSKIVAVLKVGDNELEATTKVDTGTLTVLSTTNKEYTTDLNEDSSSRITADVNDGTKFTVNDSEVTLEPEDVKLLVDSVSNNDDFNAAIEDDARNHVDMSDAGTESFYLDLVHADNGNVQVGLDGSLTISWPMPDDADPDGEFTIVHYVDMDRSAVMGEDDLANADKERISVTPNGDQLVFNVDSFSPFVLVYEAEERTPIIPIPDPDDDDDDDTEYVPKWLNTEDHFAYIVGYEDGEVKPNNNITRAEVATIFFRLLTDDARARYWSQTNDYSDIAPESWYNNAVSTLSNMGIINGYEDGTFKPNAPITRAEFTAIATRFFDYTAEYDGAFNDVSRSAWYADCVQAAVDMGLVDGYPDGGFHPNSNITRAEAVTIVNRVLNRAPHEDHLLDEDEMNVWPDNVYGAWYYADMQEATNSHDYDWIRVSGERVEEWTEKLPERDWAALEQEWSSAYSG